jgi:hypothetical protein
MKKKISLLSFALTMVLTAQILTTSCKHDDPIVVSIKGFEFLNKIPGLWHGPVTSTTTAGNFDDWYLDFRPVSATQVSQFSLLDTSTVNNISFFIVKYKGELSLAMRTEGCRNNSCCVTYEVMDSANDGAGYYRFADFIRGTARAYTEFTFNGDQMLMKVYTSRFDSVQPAILHSTYTATIGSRDNIAGAVSRFGYPKPEMTKDFSNAFAGMNQSIFFTFENDPYSSVTQPYVGSATAHITIDTSLSIVPTDQVFLMFTTQPLFDGSTYHPERLKYISRYVFLSVNTSQYKIRSIHPGTYYVYSLIDKDNDGQYLTGDYMNSAFSNSFTVAENADVDINTKVDLVIP